VELFFAETQGNPYFVEELYRHLRDDGRLFDDDGGWRSGFAVGETEVPQGVRLVIGRRLDRLDPVHRRMLAAGAVIGRTFSFTQLRAAAAADDDELFDALEAAERANLVEEATTGGPVGADARHVFVHEQIRQTLLGELSLARRQRIHLRIADALEAATASPVELAHHLHAAGPAAPTDRTVTALVAAARVNLDALAFEDGLRHLDNALARADDDRRSDIRMLQVEALRGAGRVDTALTVLDDELDSAGSRAEEVALRLRRVRLLNEQYRAAEGLEDIAALVTAAADADDPELDIAVQLARGRAHYILSLDDPVHAEQSRDAYEAAYQAARARGDRASMARALLPTTWFTDYWADYGPTAAANVAEALALAEELGDEDLELDARAASMHRGGVGFNGAASEALLARLEARRDPVKLNAHCFWLMWQYSALGRYADAVATCDRGIELAELIGSAPVQYGSIKAIALSEMGRFHEVDAAIAEEVTDDAHPFGQAMASLARSVFLARIGAWGPATGSLADTLARATELSRVWMQYWAGSLLAAVAAECRRTPLGPVPDLGSLPSFGRWDRGMTGAWIALAEGRPEAVVADAAALTAEGAEGPNAETLRGLDLVARAHLELGDEEAALGAATRGVALAETMEAMATGWRLRRVRALALDGLGRGEEAETEASRAVTEFETLARRIADPDLERWFRGQSLAPPR
jgi:tetratricopeptide (TPR) repeat protein